MRGKGLGLTLAMDRGAAGLPAKKRRVRSQLAKKEIDSVCERLLLTDKEQLVQQGITRVEARANQVTSWCGVLGS